jgi:hypothetical protein
LIYAGFCRRFSLVPSLLTDSGVIHREPAVTGRLARDRRVPMTYLGVAAIDNALREERK